MLALGTIVNTGAILVGGTAGALLKNGISEKYKSMIQNSIGLAVIAIGISGTAQGMLTCVSGGTLERSYTMVMIFSLLIGGIIGELLNIEGHLDHIGQRLQNHFKDGNGVSEGFIIATLLFCVGAMSIVGALEDGLNGNPSTLYAKAILDGVMAAVLASTFGYGVLFSAASVLIYQGSITLLAGVVKPLLTTSVITQISVVGNVLILAIGFSMLGIKKIKVGNLIPAVFIPIVYYSIQQIVLHMG